MIKLARQELRRNSGAPLLGLASAPSPSGAIADVEFPRCAIPLLGDDARTEPALASHLCGWVRT
jgi:hypothetical protein